MGRHARHPARPGRPPAAELVSRPTSPFHLSRGPAPWVSAVAVHSSRTVNTAPPPPPTGSGPWGRHSPAAALARSLTRFFLSTGEGRKAASAVQASDCRGAPHAVARPARALFLPRPQRTGRAKRRANATAGGHERTTGPLPGASVRGLAVRRTGGRSPPSPATSPTSLSVAPGTADLAWRVALTLRVTILTRSVRSALPRRLMEGSCRSGH